MRSFLACVLGVACLWTVGCAGMVVGSGAWFDGQKSDVQPLAAADLGCTDAITYTPVAHDDYREVEARGCGKMAHYELIKVGPFKKWSKSGDVKSM